MPSTRSTLVRSLGGSSRTRATAGGRTSAWPALSAPSAARLGSVATAIAVAAAAAARSAGLVGTPLDYKTRILEAIPVRHAVFRQHIHSFLLRRYIVPPSCCKFDVPSLGSAARVNVFICFFCRPPRSSVAAAGLWVVVAIFRALWEQGINKVAAKVTRSLQCQMLPLGWQDLCTVSLLRPVYSFFIAPPRAPVLFFACSLR
mmetsp:Transcript_39562/g.100453  ORF Transcript_39562/g.100453 Transcript_39562/m.100453 type:complete len:202 (+) Transcript_39562:284-889(+)